MEDAQDKIIERLRYSIEDKCLTVKSFASVAGVDVSNFSKMLSGKLNITITTLNKIAKAHGINIDWLKTGAGEMLAIPDRGETKPRIPMRAAAGSLNGFSAAITLENCEQIPVIKAFPQYDYTIIIKGDSMEPKFEGGDEIAIRRVHDVIEWGKVYVLDTRDGAVIKRLYDDGENYRCVSYNKDYPDFAVHKSDVFGVYKVVGLIRM